MMKRSMLRTLTALLPFGAALLAGCASDSKEAPTMVVAGATESRQQPHASVAARSDAARSDAARSDAARSDVPEETVTLEELPTAVKDTLLAQSAGGIIREIERETRNGATTYESEFEVNGELIEVRIDAAGQLLRRTVERKSVGAGRGADDDDDEDDDADDDDDDGDD